MTYASEVAADSPELWWRLGESSGTSAVDASGNARHGTYYDLPALSQSSLIFGDANTAAGFDGDSRVEADLTGVLASFAGLSVEFWFKTTDADASLFTFGEAYNWFALTTAGEFQAFQYLPDDTFLETYSAIAVDDGAPHHCVMTWDSTTGDAAVYLDGVEVNSGGPFNAAGSVTYAALGSPFVGASFGSDVVIDEFAIYDHQLAEARVLAHYEAGAADVTDHEVTVAGTLPAVVGAFRLDNGELNSVRAAGVMPSVVASFALAGVADSQPNRAGGFVWDNIGEATWSPTVVEPTEILPENRVVALAYTAPTIDGTHVLIEPDELAEPAHRDRIIVNGIDITYFRGVTTPTPNWQYVMPLGWAAGSFRFPQAVVPFETPGVGALSFLKKFAPVVVQRIDTSDNSVVRTDYRGFVLAHSISGGQLVIELAGHGVGRAALQDRQMMLIQQRFDAGAHVRRALEAMRVKCSPPRGAVTGINLIRWGGGGLLDYFNELVAKMTTLDGEQYTVMPTDDATYVTALKDLTTIHGTVYLDDARIKGDLRSDASEEPNRIFASGVTPDGMVVKFGAYPGLIQGTPAPYPMNDNSSFGIGTEDGDTDTGDGITVMVWQLRSRGFVDLGHAFDVYDAEVVAGIKDLQRRARLTVTGTMNPNTWRALFDLSVTGYNLSNIRVLPAAEDPRTQPWRLSANGSIIARNPAYDPSVIPVDQTIAMGAGFTRAQIRQWARGRLVTEGGWRGVIEINTGAIVAGDHEPGSPITALLRSRDIRPGMNLSLPLFAGGIVVHIAGVDVDNESDIPNGRVRLAVDTRPGDTMPVWAAIQRDRDNRNTVHRSFNAQRKSSTFDRENTIDEVGGVINPVRLNPNNWTVFPVVAKQAGTIEKVHLDLSPEREFVCAVFGRKISPGRLRRVTNAPLTEAGRRRWTEENVYDRLNRDHVVMYVAGSDEDPLGYFPGRKSDGASLLTGRWEDDASFPFVTYMNNTDRGSVLWVAVWVGASAKLNGGRIMWPSAEEY